VCRLCAISLVCPPAFAVCHLVLLRFLLLLKWSIFTDFCHCSPAANFQLRICTSAVFKFRIFALVVSYVFLLLRPEIPGAKVVAQNTYLPFCRGRWAEILQASPFWFRRFYPKYCLLQIFCLQTNPRFKGTRLAKPCQLLVFQLSIRYLTNQQKFARSLSARSLGCFHIKFSYDSHLHISWCWNFPFCGRSFFKEYLEI